MDAFWHRLGVYYGLRRDSDLEARWEAGQTDARTVLVGLPLGLAVLATALGAIVWVSRLVIGDGTSVAGVASTGVRSLWALLTFAAVCRGIGWARRRRAG